MSVKNLQHCVGNLEAAGRLIRIEQPIDAHLEAAEIQRRVIPKHDSSNFIAIVVSLISVILQGTSFER